MKETKTIQSCYEGNKDCSELLLRKQRLFRAAMKETKTVQSCYEGNKDCSDCYDLIIGRKKCHIFGTVSKSKKKL